MRRTEGLQWWIDYGNTDRLGESKDKKRTLQYEADRVAAYREKAAQEAVAATNIEEMKKALEDKIRAEVREEYNKHVDKILAELRKF